MSESQVMHMTADEISGKIERLASLADLDLKKAMGNLKAMLLENPAAVQNMAPEDLGELVKAQRRMVGKAADVAATKPKRKVKAKALTVDEIMGMDVDDL